MLLGKYSGCCYVYYLSRINYIVIINKKMDILKCVCGDCFYKYFLFFGVWIILIKLMIIVGIVLYILYIKVLIKYFVIKDGLWYVL